MKNFATNLVEIISKVALFTGNFKNAKKQGSILSGRGGRVENKLLSIASFLQFCTRRLDEKKVRSFKLHHLTKVAP